MAVAAATRPIEPEDDKRMELTEHLGELRSRIMRCILYIATGSTISYYIFKPLYHFLFRPMEEAMHSHAADITLQQQLSQAHFTPEQVKLLTKLLGGATGPKWQIAFTNFADAFFVVLKICIVAGIIMSLPLILMEVYGFIAPALTRQEKKPLRYVAPLSIILFAAGVVLAYWVSSLAIGWFGEYIDLFPRSVLIQDPQKYVMFMLKMMGIFGLVFQLPIALMFLAWVGILRSAAMKRTWRHAIVVISIVGLVVTPSNDVFTMMVMIVPVILLYIGSIWLVQFVEKKRAAAAR